MRPARGSAVVAQGKACASREEFLRQTNVTVRREGSTLRVDVQVPEEMSGVGIFYANLDLTVDVGQDFTLVGDSSGEVKVSGVKGQVRLP